MKYHILKYSSDPPEVGDFPQCDISKNINPWDPDGIYNVRPHKFPDFVPKVELELNPKARWTDFLSTVGANHGFMVTHRLKQILEEHRLPPCAFYPIKVHSKDGTRDYFWFHFMSSDFWKWIDRKKSKLYLRSILPDKRKDIIDEADLFLSPEELVNLSRNIPRMTDFYWEELYFNPTFPNLDIVKIPSPGLNIIMSEKLLKTFQEAGITGYEIKDFCVQE